MNISELKKQKDKKVSELIETSLMFFAFSNEQFYKNKTPLKEGEKYASIGAGAYMPASNLQVYKDGMIEIDNWYKSQVKAKNLRKKEIEYQLNNYECYYTGEIDDVIKAMPECSIEEIRAVYQKTKNKFNY